MHGDKRTKIIGNEVTEVISDRKIVINGNDDLFVNKEQFINITSHRGISIGGDLSETISGAVQKVYLSTLATTVVLSTTLLSGTTIDITGLGNVGISTDADFAQTVTGTSTTTVTGAVQETFSSSQTTNVSSGITITGGPTFKVTAGRIDLN